MLSDDEARRMAEAMVNDYLAGVMPDPVSVYSALGDDDRIPLGRHLIPRLTEALKAFRSGDQSRATLKLVDMALQIEDQREQAEAERKRRRLEALRVKALLFAGNPELAAQMTLGSRICNVPLPASATELKHDTWAVTGFTVAELIDFYLRYMSAAGWVFDLRNSMPSPSTQMQMTYAPLCFDLPDPRVSLIIRVWDDRQVAPCPAIQIQRSDDEDPVTFDWLGMAT